MERQNPNKAQLELVKESHDSRDRQNIILFSFMIVLLGLAYLVGKLSAHRESTISSSSHSSIETKYVPETTHQKKVHAYLQETGRKLNRDRIRAELQSLQMHPRRGVVLAGPNEVKANALLGGVPLSTQGHPAKGFGEKEEIRAESPAAEIQETLRQEQQINDEVAQKREQFIKDLHANARRAGLKLKIDKNNNVIDIQRVPQSQNLESLSGSASGSR